MTNDFNNLKISTFTGINDNPVAPTANKAGNGSHLISQFNSLLDTLTNILSPTGSNSQNVWITRTYGGNINSFERVLIDTTDNNVNIELPLEPNQGDWVKLAAISNSNTAYVSFGSHNYQAQPLNTQIITVRYEEITFTYINQSIGWITSNSSILQTLT